MLIDLQEITKLNNADCNGKECKILAIIYKPVKLKSVRNTDYFNLQLVSKEFSIDAKKWRVDKEDQEIFQQGNLVEVLGNINVFNDKKQIIINQISLLNDADLRNDLLPKPPISIEELKNDFQEFIQEITDQDYAKIINTIFSHSKLNNSFYEVRAGLTIHHNVVGGLLWHTVTLLKAANNLLKIYNYLPINKSLLFAGIILHDIGKIWEIGDYFQAEYSLKGKLLGHISIGSALVAKVNAMEKLNIPEEKLALLQHVILASHGELEYGSPIKPIIIEALITSKLDDMDAKLNYFFNKTKDLNVGEYSEKVFNGNKYFVHQTHKKT